jgi:glutamate racemase
MAPVIGVFDSGVGGLTVLRELLRVVPGADYLYFGDTARLPYGSKSAHTVARYANSATRFLEHHGAQLLVIACNTATALAFDEIRAGTGLPVIGVVEPGAQRVAEISKTRKAAVIATEATVASHAYQKALARLGIEATEKACPLLVPLVEEGWVDHPVTEQVAHIYLDEIFNDSAKGADVLMLGCTHYPLLSALLRRVAPPAVQIVDSAECTARQVAEQIGATGHSEGTLKYFATDSVEKFRRLGSRFLGRPIEKVELIDIEDRVVDER